MVHGFGEGAVLPTGAFKQKQKLEALQHFIEGKGECAVVTCRFASSTFDFSADRCLWCCQPPKSKFALARASVPSGRMDDQSD